MTLLILITHHSRDFKMEGKFMVVLLFVLGCVLDHGLARSIQTVRLYSHSHISLTLRSSFVAPLFKLNLVAAVLLGDSSALRFLNKTPCRIL